MPLITDPFFYLVAIPAVLLLGLSKTGIGAGLGSLAVPLMALAVPVPQAAAILMPVLLVMDVMAMAAFRKDVDWKLFTFLLPMGLIGVVAGALLFGLLDARWVSGVVGGLTLLFLAQRLLFPPRPDAPAPPKWAGGLLGVVSGFSSFVAHVGGPPINAYLIPLRLPPPIFIGTMAFYFFFINFAKWLPYAWLGLLDLPNMATSLVLLPMVPVGVWLGARIAHRIQPSLFYRILYAGMFLTGCKLLWDALAIR